MAARIAVGASTALRGGSLARFLRCIAPPAARGGHGGLASPAPARATLAGFAVGVRAARAAFATAPAVGELAQSEPEVVTNVMSLWQERLRQLRASPKFAAVLQQRRPDAHGVHVCHDAVALWDDIECVGFDLDFTLANWKPSIEPLIFNAAAAYLADAMSYPSAVRELVYKPGWAIRGLFWEPSAGLLLKLDAALHIEVAFHGRRQLPYAEVEELFPGGHVTRDRLPHLRPLYDQYALPEADLLSQVMQLFVDLGMAFDPASVFEDVLCAIGSVHIGSNPQLHTAITARPDAYLDRNEALVRFLARLKREDKRTFLLTNSPWTYVDSVMNYLTHGLLPTHDMAHWTELFDIVNVSAGKPDFFRSSRPFRQIDPATGAVRWEQVPKLASKERMVVAHGNVARFAADTRWHNTLFLGDHLGADARDPRGLGWKTGVVLRELPHEVAVQNSEAYRAKLAELQELRVFLSEVHGVMPGLDREQRRLVLTRLRRERQRLRDELRAMFGSPFGSVLVSGLTGSLFSTSVMRHSDLYLASVAALGAEDEHGNLRQRYFIRHDTAKPLPSDSHAW